MRKMLTSGRVTTKLLQCGAGLAMSLLGAQVHAGTIPTNFNGYGTTVNGFQDFFTGSSSSEFANYTEISNASVVTTGSSGNFTMPGDGTLHINSGSGDPNKLLYSGATYDSTNQNVLAMIEVTSSSSGDGFRGGVGAESSATNGQGINTLFRNNGSVTMSLLNDSVAWGPSFGTWQANTYYWVRETTAGTSITAELWPADGTTPESSAVTTTWTAGTRSGLAGLVADSSGGAGTFQVNYLLIQASGLPSITAGTPEPASAGLLGAVGGALLLKRRRRR